MNIKTLAAAAASLIVLGVSAHTAQAQVSNGSFESVSGPVGTFNGDTVYSTATSWTTSGTDVLFTGAEGTTDGVEAAVFNGGNMAAKDSLTQTLSTVAGKTYTVSFDFGAYGGPGTENLFAQTLNGGTQLNSTFVQSAGPSGSSANFAPYSFDFTAASSSTLLQFLDVGSSTIGIDGVLDNVSVTTNATPTPEPGSVAAFAFTGMGILGLMMRARKSRVGSLNA